MPFRSPLFSEDEMQEKVALYFTNRRFKSSDPYKYDRITPKIYREVRIPQIGRISDVIVYITDRKIINIECKLSDYNSVLKQAKDHLSWADYSYVCIPAETYLPAFILDDMITHGIGLLFWCPDYFVEVLQSGYNKKKDKSIRETVMMELKRRNGRNSGKKEIANQAVIFGDYPVLSDTKAT